MEEAILGLLRDRVRVAPRELVRMACAAWGMEAQDARRVLRRLLDRGELRYTWELGTAFVERNFSGCHRLSGRLWLQAGVADAPPERGRLVVRISPGGSFGDGRHPTTRLACRLIENALSPSGALSGRSGSRVLDVGCGSGILALAALVLGADTAQGLDTDPVALHEARENAAQNRMEDRFTVSDAPLSSMAGGFDLVAANLRTPTLHSMMPEFARLAGPGAMLVVSGMRPTETTALSDRAAAHFEPVSKVEEGGWSAMSFARKQAFSQPGNVV